MIREKSCGAVVYTEIGGVRNYLIVRMKNGHYGMPKGHIEEGESEKQTAEREIFEETGLRVSVDTGFRKGVMYKPYEGCLKDVIFFVAHADSAETVAQESEIRSIHWRDYEGALDMLTYENDKDVLRHARMYIDRTAVKRQENK